MPLNSNFFSFVEFRTFPSKLNLLQMIIVDFVGFRYTIDPSISVEKWQYEKEVLHTLN